MGPTDIKQLIETDIAECTAIVNSRDGKHYTALVISPSFAQKNRIEKQQMVHAALNKHLAAGTIHAISIKTFTPEEWQQYQPTDSEDG